jgi:hypothetical protein
MNTFHFNVVLPAGLMPMPYCSHSIRAGGYGVGVAVGVVVGVAVGVAVAVAVAVDVDVGVGVGVGVETFSKQTLTFVVWPFVIVKFPVWVLAPAFEIE